jgi:hypothetical protein
MINNIRKTLLLSTAVVVALTQPGFVAFADPKTELLNDNMSQPHHSATVSAILDDPITLQKQAENLKRSVPAMEDTIERMNVLSSKLIKGDDNFLRFSPSELDNLNNEGWVIRGYSGGKGDKSDFEDLSGIVCYNRDQNVITVVDQGTPGNAEDGVNNTKQKVLGLMKEIVDTMTPWQKKNVKVVFSGYSQADETDKSALADAVAKHGKELFGSGFDNEKSGTFNKYFVSKPQAELIPQEDPKNQLKGNLLKEIFNEAKSKILSTFAKKDDREELNVLCLDGGGTRGIGTLKMLADLEKETGKKVYDMYDRIYGTSTGGLMAILLATGKSASEVLDIYLKGMDRIFYRSWGDAISNPAGLHSAMYNPAGLEGLITELLGEAKLKDVKVPVAVTYVDKATQRVKLLSSENEKTSDVTILEAGRATSAAPTYFPAKEVQLKHKKITAIDGGVGANNPSEQALMDLKKKYGQGFETKYKVNLLSLGTGVEAMIKIDDNAGKLALASPGTGINYIMGTNEANIEKRVKTSYKLGELESYHRINFTLTFAIDLADTSKVAKDSLMQLADKRTQEDDWKKYVEALRKAN